MGNHITLVGTIVAAPRELYAPSGAMSAIFTLSVPVPEDAPATYWSLTYDLRTAGGGSNDILIICWGEVAQTCLRAVHAGDHVRVEGRLALTALNIAPSSESVPLAEVVATHIIRVSSQ